MFFLKTTLSSVSIPDIETSTEPQADPQSDWDVFLAFFPFEEFPPHMNIFRQHFWGIK